MFASGHAGHPPSPGLDVRREPHRASTSSLEAGIAAITTRLSIRRWSAHAWGAICATSVFIALTCWWLTQDRSVPIYDAGAHLKTAIEYHSMLAAGNLLGPLKAISVYPVFAHVVGAVGMFIGGVSVPSAIIAENVVFVSFLALGCYQTGRLLFGSLAGMLAVIFVLGSPLIISLFHVYMLDAPLAAVVALSFWLVLASEDFSRPGVSALAGLAVGLGLNVKSQFAQFLAGLVLIVLLHGGWRNWRGFLTFCAVALVVGAPWYLVHFSELSYLLEVASTAAGTPPGNIPPTLTVTNFTWYFWSVLNAQVLAPLFLLVIGGTLWSFVTVARRPGGQGARLEFLAGGLIAWLIVTLTPHHDIRYGLPLVGYVAVIATGWIAHIPRTPRIAAITVLVLGVCANTLGVTFGIGHEVKVALASPLSGNQEHPGRITLYTANGFLASGPRRDGDVPGLLNSLHREGVRTVTWGITQSRLPPFSFEGVQPLALMAGLNPVLTETPQFANSTSVATLLHQPIAAGAPPPCTRVSGGISVWVYRVSEVSGIWVVRFDPAAHKLALYCPSRHPQYYDVGAVG